jgi:hypothetical protein
MKTPVPTAHKSRVTTICLEKPLALNGPVTDLHALGFHLYHKRVTFLARRMPEAFAVYTPDGMQQGAAGDYVILNLAGECWPIYARLFEETYGPATSYVEPGRSRESKRQNFVKKALRGTCCETTE